MEESNLLVIRRIHAPGLLVTKHLLLSVVCTEPYTVRLHSR